MHCSSPEIVGRRSDPGRAKRGVLDDHSIDRRRLAGKCRVSEKIATKVAGPQVQIGVAWPRGLAESIELEVFIVAVIEDVLHHWDTNNTRARRQTCDSRVRL